MKIYTVRDRYFKDLESAQDFVINEYLKLCKKDIKNYNKYKYCDYFNNIDHLLETYSAIKSYSNDFQSLYKKICTKTTYFSYSINAIELEEFKYRGIPKDTDKLFNDYYKKEIFK